MRIFKILLVAFAGLAFAAIAPMPALAQVDIPPLIGKASGHDPAKVAVTVQIIDNLKMFEVITQGGRQGINDIGEVKAMSPKDRAELLSLFEDELNQRKPVILEMLAGANCDRFTLAQLNDILVLSKIDYVQQLVLKGADPSRPQPNPASMSQTEAATFIRLGNQPYVEDFMTNFVLDPIQPEIISSLQAATIRFNAYKTAGN